jgi:hypothetical protein
VRANLRLPADRPFASPSADHDVGLRALRLIDFIRLDLHSSGVPRPDLVAELIANYSSSRGWSSVRGEQIKVSFESFANALCLPPHGTPAGSVAVADRAAVASAAREFTRVYIGAPAEAATAVKRRLPGVFFEKDASRGPEYTTELLWELVKHEMEHLVQSESTDWVSYYAAFLQRLVWVERPELFQLPPAVAPAAFCVCNQEADCGSEFDIDTSEGPSSKQIDMASKKLDVTSNKTEAAKVMAAAFKRKQRLAHKRKSKRRYAIWAGCVRVLLK